jgi:hypothetical protein
MSAGLYDPAKRLGRSHHGWIPHKQKPYPLKEQRPNEEGDHEYEYKYRATQLNEIDKPRLH